MIESTAAWHGWAFVLAAGLCSTAGNVLVKQSRLAVHDPGVVDWRAWWLMAVGITFFIGHLIALAGALDRLPVSRTSPALIAVGFVTLNAAAVVLFNERLSSSGLAGQGLILTGIAMVMLGR